MYAWIQCLNNACSHFVHVLHVIIVVIMSLMQVAVARIRSTQQVYALKIMNKWDMLRRGEVYTQTQTCTHINRSKNIAIFLAVLRWMREERQVKMRHMLFD